MHFKMGTFLFSFLFFFFYKILFIPCIFPLLSKTTWGASCVPEGRPLLFFVALLSRSCFLHMSSLYPCFTPPDQSRFPGTLRGVETLRRWQHLSSWHQHRPPAEKEMRQAFQSLKCACVPGPATAPALFAVGVGPSVSHYCCTCSITVLPEGSPSLDQSLLPPGVPLPSLLGGKIIWTFVFTSLIILSLS